MMDVNLSGEIGHISKVETICRFCLTQEMVSNISSDEYLQIMVCPTLAQYDDDDTPYMCADCRLFIQHSFNFHRMCKKAHKLLAQYQFTGILPLPLEKPSLPYNKSTIEASINTSISVTSIGSQTEEVFENVEYTVCVSENEAEENEMLHSENVDSMSLDDETCQEAADQAMFAESSILYLPSSTDENLILEDNDETNKSINEATSNDCDNVFDCNLCKMTFPLRQLLEIHLNEHSRERKFNCDKCTKKFFTKKDLTQHETVHSGERPFKCSVCNKSYTRKYSLERHECKHSKTPQYLCSHCDKSLPTRDALENHMKIHSNANKFTCSVCYKSFSFRKNLLRHSALHYQTYTCEYCDEGFSTKQKLSAHLLTHRVVDSTVAYCCEKCDQSFNSSKKYNQHMLLQHNEKPEKSLNCFYCNSNFKNREQYVKHTAEHSKESLICTICMMQFQKKVTDTEIDEHIQQHIRGEFLSCEFCNFLCLTETELSLHTC